MRKFILFFLFLVASSICISSCKGEDKKGVDSSSQENAMQSKGQSAVVDNVSAANALQVAKSLADFSTLVVAIEAAGVEDAVVNVGPLTIFAPVKCCF